MHTDLLQTLQILTNLVVQLRRQRLHELAIAHILLTIEEPIGNFVLLRVLHDRHQLLHLQHSHHANSATRVNSNLILAELAGTLVYVNVGLATHGERVASAHACADKCDKSMPSTTYP